MRVQQYRLSFWKEITIKNKCEGIRLNIPDNSQGCSVLAKVLDGKYEIFGMYYDLIQTY